MCVECVDLFSFLHICFLHLWQYFGFKIFFFYELIALFMKFLFREKFLFWVVTATPKSIVDVRWRQNAVWGFPPIILRLIFTELWIWKYFLIRYQTYICYVKGKVWAAFCLASEIITAYRFLSWSFVYLKQAILSLI